MTARSTNGVFEVEPNYHLMWALEHLRDEYGAERNNLQRLLDPVEQELTAIHSCLDSQTPPSDEHERWSYESFVENKCEDIEGLLAVAFVTAQTHVTQVVSRAMRVLDAAKLAGKPLPVFAGSKKECKKQLLGYGSPLVPPTPYTQIEVLDAFANYFKHHEEWRGDWAKLKSKDDNVSVTVSVIMAAGASQGSTGNFRSGAEALGNGSYKNVGVFVSNIAGWRNKITDALESAAHEAGLL